MPPALFHAPSLISGASVAGGMRVDDPVPRRAQIAGPGRRLPAATYTAPAPPASAPDQDRIIATVQGRARPPKRWQSRAARFRAPRKADSGRAGQAWRDSAGSGWPGQARPLARAAVSRPPLSPRRARQPLRELAAAGPYVTDLGDGLVAIELRDGTLIEYPLGPWSHGPGTESGS